MGVYSYLLWNGNLMEKRVKNQGRLIRSIEPTGRSPLAYIRPLPFGSGRLYCGGNGYLTSSTDQDSPGQIVPIGRWRICGCAWAWCS